MARGDVQLRLRLPDDVYEDVRREAELAGSTIQRELLMRIKLGSASTREKIMASAYGRMSGDLKVALHLAEPLLEVLSKMKKESESRIPLDDEDSVSDDGNG